MRQATLIKSGNPWRLSGLRGMSLEELNSTLDQVLSEPGCPGNVLLVDLGENYTYQELGDKTIRQLLWNKL